MSDRETYQLLVEVMRAEVSTLRETRAALPKRRSRVQPITVPKVKRAQRLAEAVGIDPKNVTFHPDGSFTFGGAAAPAVEDNLDRELAEFEARHGKG